MIPKTVMSYGPGIHVCNVDITFSANMLLHKVHFMETWLCVGLGASLRQEGATLSVKDQIVNILSMIIF